MPTPDEHRLYADLLAGLEVTTARRTELKEQLDRATTDQHEQIKAALAAGVPVPDLRRVTRLSRPRIYQIRG